MSVIISICSRVYGFICVHTVIYVCVYISCTCVLLSCTCSIIIETLEKGVKYVQTKQ